jgi:hypothetical protein
MVNTIRYFNKWGWFFDPKRRKTNKRVLEELEYKLAKKEMHKQKLNAK